MKRKNVSWWKYKSLYQIKWIEPYAVSREIAQLGKKSTKWFMKPLLGFSLSSVFMLIWYLSTQNPKISPPSFQFALVLAICSGLGIVYLVSLAYHILPYEIGFSENAIVRMSGRIVMSWRYKDIKKYNIVEHNINNKVYKVLRIKLINDQDIAFGISHKLSIDDLRNILYNKGIEAS